MTSLQITARLLGSFAILLIWSSLDEFGQKAEARKLESGRKFWTIYTIIACVMMWI
jgi:hypothetical protein